MSDPVRGSVPNDRLSRIADRMTDFLHADPEYDEDDKCIIFLDDHSMGGICLDGYDNDASALADLLMHLQAIMKANGKTLDLMFLGPDGVDRVYGR